jgi:diacylglycerol kinase (ATP)
MSNKIKDSHNPNHQLPPKTIAYSPIRSVYYASQGVVIGFKREPNLAFQAIIGVFTALILGFNKLYLIALVDLIMMFFTVSSEFFNTSIEAVCDLIHPQYSLKVKVIKDLAAAGVWMISLAWLTFLIYCAYRLWIL